MTIPIYIKIVENPPVVITRQEHGQVMAAVYEAEAQDWASRLLPLHFLVSAHARYGYQDRKPKTISRKIKDVQKGKAEGVQDLVWTGAMRRVVLGYQEIRTSSNKAVARIFGPKYAYQYKPGGPDKQAEILKVIEEENQSLGLTAQKTYEAEMNTRHFAPQTTTIGNTP